MIWLNFNLFPLHPNSIKGIGRTAAEQAGYQTAGIVSTIIVAVVGGLITGFILDLPSMRNLKKDEHHDDDIFWNVPDDFKHI